MSVHFRPQLPLVERAERTLTLLMVAKLRIGGREGLCRIRNVSSGGLMFECRMPVECGEQAEIEARGQGRYSGRIVWVRDGLAGLAFDQAVPLDELLAASAPGPSRIRKNRHPRGPRLQVDCTVEVQLDGGRVEAMLKDISQGGAKLIMPFKPQRGERLLLMVPGLPMKLAIVQWSGSEIGVAFAEPLSFDILAGWLLVREGGETWRERG